jgi:trehalose 6-phosphate synthase/phosphatase
MHSPTTWMVSNRLPFRLNHDTRTLERNDGGLVTALLPIHQAGSSWWVGQGSFPGLPGLDDHLEKERVLNVVVDEPLAKAHYNGASNGGIWPLFHYFPAIARFDPSEWGNYRMVNAIFAKAILARAQPGDRVWIHDYQLMLLPGILRAEMPELCIGYFHHIPFPASEVLKIHPARDEILRGLLGADVVGFHTLEYARHFVAAAGRVLGVEAIAEELHFEDRLVRVGAFPLGIDAHEIELAMETGEHRTAIDILITRLNGRHLILGVDRLDYTKGIPERLAAFERFLRLHPTWRDRVTFIQLCVPSRIEIGSYENLRQEVERLVGRINGELGSDGHVPVHYLFQRRTLGELTALYHLADVCLVTPLRDGLNLVCKEFVAARDDLDGVLVLSEFAGAAEEMGEALVVNPFDVDAVAEAIHQALIMPQKERSLRMKALRRRVVEANNREWANGFIGALDDMDTRNRSNASRALAGDELAQQVRELTRGHGVAALDADIVEHLGASDEGLERLIRAVIAIGLTPVVISSLPRQRIDSRWHHLTAWIAAERGAFVRDQTGIWIGMPAGESLDSYRAEVRRCLDHKSRLIPRSTVIENEASIHLQVGRRPSPLADAILRETVHVLDGMLARSPWHATRTASGLVVRSGHHHAGSALEAVAKNLGILPDAPVLVVGDRYSDDSLFRWRPNACSIAVGTPVSSARYLVAHRAELASVLRHLVRGVHA